MFLFSHLGITLCAGLVVNRIAKSVRVHFSQSRKNEFAKQFENPKLTEPVSLLGMNFADVVFCSVGSILPDIIDKPIGQYFFARTFGQNGRIFSHTLLFLAGSTIAGVYFYLFRRKTWLLYLAFGVLMHLTLDFMWQTPQTLFWPLLGWHFPVSTQGDLKFWVNEKWRELARNPSAYIPEIIGLLVGIVFMLMIIKARMKRPHSIKRKRP